MRARNNADTQRGGGLDGNGGGLRLDEMGREPVLYEYYLTDEKTKTTGGEGWEHVMVCGCFVSSTHHYSAVYDKKLTLLSLYQP